MSNPPVSTLKELAFLVRLARTPDWKTLRPGDQLNLRQDVADFLSRPLLPGDVRMEPRVMNPAKGSYVADSPLDAPDSAITGLLDFSHNVIREHLRWRDFPPPSSNGPAQVVANPIGWKVETLHVSIGTPAVWPDSRGGTDVCLTIAGPLEAVFRWKVLDVLRATALSHLRICPECEHVFVRVRRAERCSRQCTNAYWNKLAAEKPGATEKRRVRADRSYRRKVAKRAPGARVTRRPRKQRGD